MSEKEMMKLVEEDNEINAEVFKELEGYRWYPEDSYDNFIKWMEK